MTDIQSIKDIKEEFDTEVNKIRSGLYDPMQVFLLGTIVEELWIWFESTLTQALESCRLKKISTSGRKDLAEAITDEALVSGYNLAKQELDKRIDTYLKK